MHGDRFLSDRRGPARQLLHHTRTSGQWAVLLLLARNSPGLGCDMIVPSVSSADAAAKLAISVLPGLAWLALSSFYYS